MVPKLNKNGDSENHTELLKNKFYSDNPDKFKNMSEQQIIDHLER